MSGWNPKQAALIDSLQSKLCPGCLGGKRSRRSVCLKCWKKLPVKVRAKLYCMMGAGYEAAHDAAMRKLGQEPMEGQAS